LFILIDPLFELLAPLLLDLDASLVADEKLCASMHKNVSQLGEAFNDKLV
jgi:hypothetical protein